MKRKVLFDGREDVFVIYFNLVVKFIKVEICI